MKPVHFVGSCLRDLRNFPEGARSEAGYAIHLAQMGEKAVNAVPMTGFGGASVLEVVIPEGGDTYRAVYTIRFAEAIYVLHAFQKKSKRGRRTPSVDVALIQSRLKYAERHYREIYISQQEEKRYESGA